jgi:hypothetical protein
MRASLLSCALLLGCFTPRGPAPAAVAGQPIAPSAVAGTQEGLVAWYRFEESGGPVLDSSGHRHHGAAEGAGISRGVPGRIGNAIAFDGSGGYVRVPASKALDFIQAGTIELWMNLAPGGGDLDVGSTVSRGTGNTDDNVLMNTSCGNMQTIFSRSGKGSTNVTSGCGRFQAGSWVHVAVVNDGGSATLYINGARELSAQGGFLGPLESALYIGVREQGVFPLRGALDEIKWWSVARSQPEICADAGGRWDDELCLFR